MLAAIEQPINAKAEQIRAKFKALLDKTNKESPRPQDLKALSELLSDNRGLQLWRDVASAGYLAELLVIENARATPAVKECWKHRLQGLKRDLGSEGAPLLEQLLIQQAALCWLKLNRVELSYASDEAINHTGAWHVLGEAVVSSSKAVYASLRDPDSN